MEIIVTTAILVCVALAVYLLYINGYIPVQAKRALVFVGSMGGGRKQCSAEFEVATGTIQRVIRFREPGTVTFRFAGNITKGSVGAFVLDRKRKVLLRLDSECPTGKVYMEMKDRCYLVIKLQKANGNYLIRWD